MLAPNDSGVSSPERDHNGVNGGTVNRLQVNGHSSPVRQRIPSRDVSPSQRNLSPIAKLRGQRQSEPLADTVVDTLKELSSALVGAEETLQKVQGRLRETLRDVQYAGTGYNGLTTFPSTLTDLANGRDAEKDKEKAKERRKAGGAGRQLLADKVFVTRNSTLTDLFAVNHIATLYHIALVVFIILILSTVVHDLVTYGALNLSMGTIWASFGGFHRVITIWIVMKIGVALLYGCYNNWAHRRRDLPKDSWQRASLDYVMLGAFLLYLGALTALPVLRMVHYDLPVASSVALLMEQTRLLMKSYAFVRSNVPRTLAEADSPRSKDVIVCPGFSQFLYFMFAPTLIYRDSYPKTPMIRWRVVVCHVLEVVGAVFYVSFLCDHYLLSQYRDFGLRPLSGLDFMSEILAAVLPAGLAFVCCFYLLLHSWHNAWAEMLCFGDRMFYMDWWNQSSFASYYRTWNVLVQDWLYTYVYKDVVMLGGSGVMAKVAVFAVSSVVHEFILAFTLRFFYPVLYVFFGVIGFLLTFIAYNRSKSIGNIFMWFSLIFGDGILFSLYAAEYYSRRNCPQTIDSAWDLFVPRSWGCLGGVRVGVPTPSPSVHAQHAEL